MQGYYEPERSIPAPLALLPVLVVILIVVLGGLATRVINPAAIAAVESAAALEAAVVAEAAEAVASEAIEVASIPANTTNAGVRRGLPVGVIATAFMPSVRYWEPEIAAWATEYGLDPNLVATVMQIESCGNPQAVSSAGAQGLFQVMPFHFAAGEDMQDPDTNADRGMAYLLGGLQKANGNAALAMAGYNGGHSVIGQGSYTWANETQRYYYWGDGIYSEVTANPGASPRLEEWLAAGGASLCAQAERVLGLR